MKPTMKSTIKLTDNIHFKHYDVNGVLKDEWTVHNLITTVGKAAFMVGTLPTYLGLGTSNTAPAVGQTALQAEITTGGLARALATVTVVTTNVTGDTRQLAKTFTASAAFTVEEIGIFSAVSGGTMHGRALTTSKILANGESIACTYSVIAG